VSKSTSYLVIAAVIAGLLSLSPMTYAQNSTNTSEIKDLYNQAKNTSMDLVNQAVTLIKNDTNSSKLLAQLESDFGNLVNEFSNFLSR